MGQRKAENMGMAQRPAYRRNSLRTSPFSHQLQLQLLRPSRLSLPRRMARTGTRLPGFCLNRIRPHARVRSPPPPIQSEPPQAAPANNAGQQEEVVEKNSGNAVEEKPSEPAKVAGRKVMIVVDSSGEAKGALQWALSHTIQSHDTIVLLHVIRTTQPETSGECSKEMAPRAYELVQAMRNTCLLKKPEVKIETLVVQGTDKGPVIVEEARKQGAALLVLGQKKQPVAWRLLMMWARGSHATATSSGSSRSRVVDYCIQNAGCMAIAVRRKSKKLGGYLITTKRQKDFWLLA